MKVLKSMFDNDLWLTAEEAKDNMLYNLVVCGIIILLEEMMDTGSGKFKEFDAKDEEEFEKKKLKLFEQYPKHGGVFKIGEEVELKGSRFRVKSIKPNELRLKLLPRKNI